MFRRRKRQQDEAYADGMDVADDGAVDDDLAGELDDELDDDEADDGHAEAEPGGIPAPGGAESGPRQGPYDDADEPDDGIVRADLGSLRVPVLDDFEVRVDVDQQTQEVVAVTLVSGVSAVQLNAFAAPKSESLWPEVRAEILETLGQSGGGGQESDGPFGPELRGRAAAPDGSTQQVRFVGVDGPRWFLRGLISGPAATDPARAEPIEAVIRQVVVVRGSEPMAPRDPLPLHLPPTEGGSPGQDGDSPPDLNPFERGPEITEIR